MKIFLTGGTGFVGREVVGQLSAIGHKVRCLVRDSEKARAVLPAGAEPFTGDLLESEDLASGLHGCDAVIHLVGIIFEKGPSTFERIHVKATLDLLAAARAAGIKRFVHMSALGSRPNAVSRYHKTKYQAEQAVRQSGMNWTVFRPSVIFGPRDRFVNVLAQVIRAAPIIPIIGHGESRVQPISVGNVAACFALAVGNPASSGKTYDLGGPEILTYNQIYRIISGVLNAKKKTVRIPAALVKPAAFVAERLLPNPPITLDQLMMLGEDNVCDSFDAVQDFRLELLPFEEGIKAYLVPG